MCSTVPVTSLESSARARIDNKGGTVRLPDLVVSRMLQKNAVLRGQRSIAKSIAIVAECSSTEATRRLPPKTGDALQRLRSAWERPACRQARASPLKKSRSVVRITGSKSVLLSPESNSISEFMLNSSSEPKSRIERCLPRPRQWSSSPYSQLEFGSPSPSVSRCASALTRGELRVPG